MIHKPTILGISGSLSEPSRTVALVRALLQQFGIQATTRLLDLAQDAPALFATTPKGVRNEKAAAIIQAVETADLLVVGSPVYRASYTGALKHLFDLVDYRALRGTPVVLCATGGTPLHGLMPEHQLRPLFGFFGAVTVPSFVYALESDFDGYVLRSPEVQERIERTVAEAKAQLSLVSARRTADVLPIAINA